MGTGQQFELDPAPASDDGGKDAASSWPSGGGAKAFARGPLPWIGAAAALVLIGTLIAEDAPSRWPIRIVESIGEPEQSWQVEHGLETSDTGFLQVALTGQSVAVYGPTGTRGFALDDGGLLWDESLDGAQDVRCTIADPAQIACLAKDTDQLVFIDTSTGSVERHRAGPILGAARVGGDTVTLTQGDETGPSLSRIGAGGDERWVTEILDQDHLPREVSSEVPGAEFEPPSFFMAADPHRAVVSVYGDFSTVLVFDMDSGEPVDTPHLSWADLAQTQPWILFDDRGALLLNARGEEQTAPGPPLDIDDSPESGVVVRNDYEAGQDASTGSWPITATRDGHELWRRAAIASVARVDNVVVLEDHAGFTGVAEESGEELWQAPHEDWGAASAQFSDGNSLWLIDVMTGQPWLLGIEDGAVRDTGLEPIDGYQLERWLHSSVADDDHLAEISATHVRVIDLDP